MNDKKEEKESTATEETKPKNNSKNKTNIVPVVLALIVGLVFGFLIANTTKSDKDDTTTTTAMSHKHKPYAYEGENPPSVQLEVIEDAVSGWNVHITTNNFTFTPQNVNEMNVQGQGHAHLYVDGKKVDRIYGNWYHYNENFDGTKTFKVTLNANMHNEITFDGKVVEASVKVSHDHEKQDNHNHDETTTTMKMDK